MHRQAVNGTAQPAGPVNGTAQRSGSAAFAAARVRADCLGRSSAGHEPHGGSYETPSEGARPEAARPEGARPNTGPAQAAVGTGQLRLRGGAGARRAARARAAPRSQTRRPDSNRRLVTLAALALLTLVAASATFLRLAFRSRGLNRLAASLVCLAAVAAIAVRPALAAGPSVTYTVSAGTPGNSGWYAQRRDRAASGLGRHRHELPGGQDLPFELGLARLLRNGRHLERVVPPPVQDRQGRTLVTGSSPDRAPNGNGWYNAPVTVSFTGSDATSGIASCTSTTLQRPRQRQRLGQRHVHRRRRQHERARRATSLKYDATPPTVTPSPARPPDANGWYNHPVSFAFSGSDSTSGIDSCTSASYSGPDAAAATVQGTCTDKAGNSASSSSSLQYDSTPPGVTTAFSRPPDANGWYNHPVTVTATGTDTGSGIDSCTGVTYSGPDNPTASLTASCVDKAGNTERRAGDLQVRRHGAEAQRRHGRERQRHGDAALGRIARTSPASRSSARPARAATPPPSTRATSASFTDVKLKNGIRYRYQLSATDAGRERRQRQRDRASPGAREPRAGPEAEEAPAAPLGHGQRRRLLQRAALLPRPQGAERLAGLDRKLALRASWKYSGDAHRLTKGTYRWYVWPGYGTRKAAHYGKLLGSGIFVVA